MVNVMKTKKAAEKSESKVKRKPVVEIDVKNDELTTAKDEAIQLVCKDCGRIYFNKRDVCKCGETLM